MNKTCVYTGFDLQFNDSDQLNVINDTGQSEGNECVILVAVVKCTVGPASKERPVLSLFSYLNKTTDGVVKFTTNTHQYTTQPSKFNSVHIRVSASY
jgi:hypothetical protein